MKRLTIRNKDGSVSQRASTSVRDMFFRLSQYEDIGLEPEEIKNRLDKFSSFLEEVTYGEMYETWYPLQDMLDKVTREESEWVMFKDEGGRIRNKCGACGMKIGRSGRKTNFCPDCGSRMINME